MDNKEPVLEADVCLFHGVWYFAQPYSHPDESVRDQRAYNGNRVSVALTVQGITVINTIWHTHHEAKLNKLPTDAAFWRNINEKLIDACEGIIVFTLPGWESSVGVASEIAYAERIGRKVYYLTKKGLHDVRPE